MLGVIVGTYSSVFVASPVLLAWQKSARARQKRRDAERYRKGSVTRSDGAADADTPSAQAAQTADAEAVKRELARKRSTKKGKKR